MNNLALNIVKAMLGGGPGIIRISQTFVGLFIFNLMFKMPIAISEPILPCIDSGNDCVNQLSGLAISNSFKLETLTARIALIDERLALAEDRIELAKDKKFLNYISVNPVEIAKNFLGGGDVQKDRIAIASLEIRTADLLAVRAELERQQLVEKVEISDRILRLLLDYESAERRHVLLNSQLANHDVQEKVARVSYRAGRGSTSQIIGMSDKRDRLEEKIVEVEIKQDEAVRELLELI